MKKIYILPCLLFCFQSISHAQVEEQNELQINYALYNNSRMKTASMKSTDGYNSGLYLHHKWSRKWGASVGLLYQRLNYTANSETSYFSYEDIKTKLDIQEKCLGAGTRNWMLPLDVFADFFVADKIIIRPFVGVYLSYQRSYIDLYRQLDRVDISNPRSTYRYIRQDFSMNTKRYFDYGLNTGISMSIGLSDQSALALELRYLNSFNTTGNYMDLVDEDSKEYYEREVEPLDQEYMEGYFEKHFKDFHISTLAVSIGYQYRF